MVSYFLFILIFSLYINFHGPYLDFLDVSLITTAVLFLIFFVLFTHEPKNRK